MIGEDVDTQLNLKWVNLDEKRNIADYCENCKTKELREKVVELVGKLVEIEKNEQSLVVNDRRKEGILFYRKKNNKWGWFEDGDVGNDSKFVGEIKNELPNGKGSVSYHDGRKYDGEFKSGKYHGLGTWTSSDSDGFKYVGEFKDGEEHGWGIFTTNGIKYDGEWKNGLPKGYVKITYPNGIIFDGIIIDSELGNYLKNVKGTTTYPNGEKYEGEFKDGEFHGQGTFTSPDREKYVGEFKDGEYHGQGTFTYPDGTKYVGKVKDGECHGQGTFTSKDGEKFVGEWKDDKEWNITEYDKNGNIIGKWVNGVKQK